MKYGNALTSRCCGLFRPIYNSFDNNRAYYLFWNKLYSLYYIAHIYQYLFALPIIVRGILYFVYYPSVFVNLVSLLQKNRNLILKHKNEKRQYNYHIIFIYLSAKIRLSNWVILFFYQHFLVIFYCRESR